LASATRDALDFAAKVRIQLIRRKRNARVVKLRGTFVFLILSALSAAPETRAQTADLLVLNVAGTKIQLESSNQFAVGAPALIKWVERSAKAIQNYYGRFPTTFLRVRLVALDGHGVRRGTAILVSHAQARIELGRDVSAAELRDDWILVHEMAHLALPDLGFESAWLSEGIATYVEGVARAQAGDRTAAQVWAAYLQSMPRGLPKPGDRGLDHTYSVDRTYWGGATFFLLADVKIRQRTRNRKGLQDALRAVARASGGLRSSWTINEVLKTADAAVGTTVLQKQYARMKDTAVRVDLPWLWRSLGIEAHGDSIVFHDDAPLARIRQAIVVSRH
jgi:hypothetical protein